MRTRLEWQWEELECTTVIYTKRAKVLGGWIVHHTTTSKKGEITESMCFVADKEHTWYIQPPFIEEKVVKQNLAKDFEAKT